MAWKPEVQTANDPKWYRNGLCFATQKEADDNGFDLMMRWGGCADTRAVEVDEPVTHAYLDGLLVHLAKEEKA